MFNENYTHKCKSCGEMISKSEYESSPMEIYGYCSVCFDNYCEEHNLALCECGTHLVPIEQGMRVNSTYTMYSCENCKLDNSQYLWNSGWAL